LKTISAPYGAQYGRGSSRSQTTGGSNNIRGWFNLMLQAGATARELLLTAARQTFPSATPPLRAVAGFVQDANGVPLASYGDLAPLAATITLPTAAPVLSTPTTRKVIGQSVQRPDIKLKVNGRAVYGIDARVPGMVYAAIRHCPTIGGTVASVGAAPTGSQLVNLGNAIAATGPNTWAAINNVRAASVSWTLPTSTALTPSIAENTGDTVTALAGAAKKLTLTYSLPLLAHACMEVMDCTVAITKDAGGIVTGCEIWAPTQAPDGLAKTAAPLLGLDPTLAADMAKIKVNTTYMGGGLGRKIENDTATQAVKVALALNKPVKLIWPREEDFARDWFRPSALSRVIVGLDAAGKIVGWANRIVSPSLARSHGRVPAATGDGISIGGAVKLLYATGPRLVEYVEQLAPNLQIGFWRSVGESISCFVVESAIDECALAAGVDPLQYRLNLLGANTPVKNVLQAAATLGGWGTPLAAGRARGDRWRRRRPAIVRSGLRRRGQPRSGRVADRRRLAARTVLRTLAQGDA
jgi:isoquinoline 1-oxidoreductase beta subunit